MGHACEEIPASVGLPVVGAPSFRGMVASAQAVNLESRSLEDPNQILEAVANHSADQTSASLVESLASCHQGS